MLTIEMRFFYVNYLNFLYLIEIDELVLLIGLFLVLLN